MPGTRFASALAACSALALALAAPAAPAADSYEPNDRPDQARPIPSSEVIESWISGPEDVDWFRFVHRDRGPLRVEIASLPADYVLEIFVQPQEGEIVSQGQAVPVDPTRNRKVFEDGLASPGEYLLRVRGPLAEPRHFDPVDSYFLVAVYAEAPVPVSDPPCAE